MSFAAAEPVQGKTFHATDFYNRDKFLKGQELEPRKDLRAFVDAMGEKINSINATGDMLKYFFSIVPPEALEGHSEFL